jgi:hypothetical protein
LPDLDGCGDGSAVCAGVKGFCDAPGGHCFIGDTGEPYPPDCGSRATCDD